MNLEKLKNGFNQYFVNVLKTQYADFKGLLPVLNTGISFCAM